MAVEQHRIYKLSDERGQVYYGSSRQPDLRARLNQHRYQARREQSRSHLLFLPTCDGVESNVKIEELECLPPGTCVAGVRARERWYIENHPCVNKSLPGRSAQESARAYRMKNRTKCREACKRWREKNPTYKQEWRAKHPNYWRDYYRAKKAKLAELAELDFELKQELSSSECMALDASEASDASSSDDGIELIYDANAWFNELCDKGFKVSLK